MLKKLLIVSQEKKEGAAIPVSAPLKTQDKQAVQPPPPPASSFAAVFGGLGGSQGAPPVLSASPPQTAPQSQIPILSRLGSLVPGMNLGPSPKQDGSPPLGANNLEKDAKNPSLQNLAKFLARQTTLDASPKETSVMTKGGVFSFNRLQSDVSVGNNVVDVKVAKTPGPQVPDVPSKPSVATVSTAKNAGRSP